MGRGTGMPFANTPSLKSNLPYPEQPIWSTYETSCVCHPGIRRQAA